jgi:hypothetical protein
VKILLAIAAVVGAILGRKQLVALLTKTTGTWVGAPDQKR